MGGIMIEAINGAAAWVVNKKIGELENLGKCWIDANPGRRIDADVIDQLLSQIPKKIDRMIDRLSEIIRISKGYDAMEGSVSLSKAEIERLLRAVKSDPTISETLK